MSKEATEHEKTRPGVVFLVFGGWRHAEHEKSTTIGALSVSSRWSGRCPTQRMWPNGPRSLYWVKDATLYVSRLSCL